MANHWTEEFRLFPTLRGYRRRWLGRDLLAGVTFGAVTMPGQLATAHLAGMPPTFNIYGEYESPRAEQELFVRKLREDGVAVRAYMNEGVGHDVQTWLSVIGERRAHKVAAGYIREGFGSAP